MNYNSPIGSLTVSERDLRMLEVEPHKFEADASELRFAPGVFPREIRTNLGNRQPLILTRLSNEVAYYTQGNGCVTLTVYNT